jgi:hypothetical protein
MAAMEVDSSDPHAQLGAKFTSSSYIPSDKDTDFLQRDELHSVRIGLELLKPELIQREGRIRSTIVVFGSARLQEPAAVELTLRLAEEQAAQAPDDRIRQQRVAIVKRQLELATYYE